MFPRLRSLSLEDLYLHLQAITNSHTTEPIDRITALRLLSWNLRDGISPFKDVSGVTAELRAWIKGKDINGVTHFAKWAVTSDKQIRLNP